MIITDNQLKGNWGEQFIAASLSSQGCFVRHVTQGHDSGIDLYCETTKDGRPYLHFWCQIKTSKEWVNEEHLVSFTPKNKRHIDYWLGQPVPVFIFLVPDLRQNFDVAYYVCSAFDFYPNKTTIHSSIKVEKPEHLVKFLEVDLPFQTFLWDLKNGKVSHLKTPQKEYIKHFPPGVSQYFATELSKSLRWTLHRLSKDILFQGRSPRDLLNKPGFNDEENSHLKRGKTYVQMLEILARDTNDRHYETYEIIGNYYEAEKEYSKSLKFYEKSLAILYQDPHINKETSPWNRDFRLGHFWGDSVVSVPDTRSIFCLCRPVFGLVRDF